MGEKIAGWKPEKQGTIIVNGQQWTIGINAYRFYLLKDGGWEPMMEFKHDIDEAHDVAHWLFDRCVAL